MTYKPLKIKALHFFKESGNAEFLVTKCNILSNKKPHNLFCIQYDMNIASLAAVLGIYNPFSVTTNLPIQMTIQ
jgi:hypothetical protein